MSRATPSTRAAAAVIYTPGSRGRSRGVMVEHRALTNLMLASLDCATGGRTLQLAPVMTDACVWEIFSALATGATLCIAPREALRPGRALLATLRELRISRLMLSPTDLAACDAEEIP